LAEAVRVSAVVGCVDNAGRVLIVKQTAGPFSGAWLLPGGNVERNENPDEAARRELFEETGYRAADLTPIARYRVRSVPAGGFHFIVHLFRADAVEGSPRPEAGSALRWAMPLEIDPHPNLAVALVDLGLIDRDQVTLAQDLAKVGIEMHRIR
jgi:8-oxo-dGTP diphosphatase